MSHQPMNRGFSRVLYAAAFFIGNPDCFQASEPPRSAVALR
jgi:hypothetical protein